MRYELPISENLACDLDVSRALTWRYLIALALVASLSTAAWLSLHLVISEQKSTAAVVNVSGRQRMLSQRTALFSDLLVNAPESERLAIRDGLREAINLMELSHQGLTEGNDAMGLPKTMSPTVHAMYFDGPNSLDTQVKTYVRCIHELLLLDDRALTQTYPLLQYITRQATGSLLVSLDKMVSQYQLEGELAVSRLQKAETLFWGITLILLVLEAVLIFHPFVNHVRKIIGKLQGVTNELQFHRDQLEETVKSRTAELESRSEALVESEERFRLISTVAKDAIVMIGENQQITYWNPAAERIFGYQAADVLGENMRVILASAEYEKVARKGFKRFIQCGNGKLVGKTFEFKARHKSGEEFIAELSISAFRYQRNVHALGIVRDISERKRMEEQVRQLAFYDPLTNLPNRRLLHDRLRQVLLSNKRTGHYAALMVLDLDNFKSLNDAHGHIAGDALLVEAADRLKLCVRESDTVARFGGDEFVVLLTKLALDQSQSVLQANRVAEKIRSTLSQPYQLMIKNKEGMDSDVEHSCSASIGIMVFANHNVAHEDILEGADAAMYRAKELGRNRISLHDGKTF